jgi:hypothetical protein
MLLQFLQTLPSYLNNDSFSEHLLYYTVKTKRTIWASFLNFIKIHIKQLDDLDSLQFYLQKIQLICALNTNQSQSKYSTITEIVKRHRINQGDNLDSEHIKIWRKYMKPSLQSIIDNNDKTLLTHTYKLSNKYTESYIDLYKTADVFINSYATEQNDISATMLVFAVQLGTGCRVSAVLHQNITFEIPDMDNNIITLGKPDSGLFAPTARVISNFKDLITQNGYLKNKEQQINKYINENDPRYVSNTPITKPTCFYSAEDILIAVKTAREYFKGSKLSPTIMNSILKQYMPDALKHAKKHNWSFGSHYFRRIYAQTAFLKYKKAFRNTLNRVIDPSVIIGSLLGHKSFMTSLSYANVEVTGFRDLPNIVVSKYPNDIGISMKNKEGNVVLIRKRKRERFSNETDRNSSIKELVDKLENANIKTTYSNLEKVGVSRSIYSKYLSKVP